MLQMLGDMEALKEAQDGLPSYIIDWRPEPACPLSEVEFCLHPFACTGPRILPTMPG